MFGAADRNGQAIYHTNVMMCIGNHFVIICSEAIRNVKERRKLLDSFKQAKLHVVEISFEQMYAFAGNMIQLKGNTSRDLLVMSGTAYRSLLPEQLAELKKSIIPVVADIPVIEESGGGSTRCMIAGIFLSRITKE